MKKNFFRFYSRITSIPIVLILFILTSTAIPQNKINKGILEGLTQDQISGFKNENGDRIFPDEDPEGDAFQTRSMTGFNPGDRFGASVKTAGDVNGDGYDDFIIGAYGNDGTGTDAGRAYIYFGGININTIPDVILSGDSAGVMFGYSVSTAGDVNGDGYCDVIVSEIAYRSNTGKVYVYFGGAGMNNTPDVTLNASEAEEYFGYSVSSAGDVNGDGYPDVIVGASFYGIKQGRAYIFYGGISMNNTADVILTGENNNDEFGCSVSGAGDVNGDGFSDVIVGANQFYIVGGRAYVFYGGTNMNNIADVSLSGPVDKFGFSVSTAGDVNGDGFSDVIVGGYGQSYIYYGSIIMNNTPDVTMIGPGGLYFGFSVSTAGDLNGDGYSDVVVGAWNYSTIGKVYVFYGDVNMNNTPDITLTGEGPNDRFGIMVSTAGDINGDGYSDLLLGATEYASFTGKAYLYMYGMNGTMFSDLTMTGEAINNGFGCSVSSAGDVNGDGYSDIIIGAVLYNNEKGRAYIFYGGPLMNNIADVTMTGEVVNSNFGSSVSSAGDVNGDGYTDVIIGAIGYSFGRAYIFYGGSLMNNVADVTMTGESSHIFGISVSGAGDVNGDGYSDVIVGTPGHLTITGGAYIFYGGSSMDSVADVTISGESTNSFFGWSVSTAGDMNGDGFSDVIIGDYGYSTNTGKGYIFYGGSAMNNVADITLNGESSGNRFGFSVSSAGDVNGDGYSDVIIGADNYGNGAGRAYIFNGGSSMNNIADVIMTGESTSNSLGYSVSGAGDINKDGYEDVIAGTYGFDRVYVFSGGSSMNNIADIILTGETAGSFFGYSVSDAGDVNGDGLSDVIIGAYAYNKNTGKSYLYFSNFPNVHPNIVSIKDIPLDQGGYVNLRWAKSAYDQQVNGSVVNYVIERSLPPAFMGFNWVTVGTVPATNVPVYNYEARTPYDSSVSSNGVFFFRVTACTNNPGEYWRSNMLSGYSIDNLAPLPPSNLAGFLNVNTAVLSWNANTETDLKQYIIFRNDVQTGTSTTLNYNDNTILPDSTYTYRITAEDIHGNISSLSNPVLITYTVSTINIKLIPQGFYNSISGMLNRSDTVKAYLHDCNSPFVLIDSAESLIDTVSFTGAFRFFNAPDGIYYIVIKHRNLIETWCKSGGVTFTSGTIMNYDFTSSLSQAYGNNMTQVDVSPLRFAIYSGDENQDGVVDLSDVLNVFNNANAFVTGYDPSDMNGDNVTDLKDVLIAYNSSYKFVGVVRP